MSFVNKDPQEYLASRSKAEFIPLSWKRAKRQTLNLP